MARRVTIVGFVVLFLVVGGLVITYLPKARQQANLATSQNNLRELGLFAAHHANPDPKRDASRLPTVIPAATLPLPNVPPDERLSWAVLALPYIDQRKNPAAELVAQIDLTQPWKAEKHQKASRTRLPVLTCPESPPTATPDGDAVTSYVGVTGVGTSAATRPPDAPKAGAFRYDAATPFTAVADGLSNTLLYGETRTDLGAWLRGGPSTARGLDDAPTAPPLIGGQFGGYFPTLANFGLCDGSVRSFTTRTTPQVLLGMATIAGGKADPLPGE